MRTETVLKTLVAAGLVSGAALAARADQVTFNVDMRHMTNSAGQPAFTAVFAAGAHNGWNSQGDALFNNGSGIYTNTVEVVSSGAYKYTCLINGNVQWEAGSDHQIALTGSPQTLPLLVFNYDGFLPIDRMTNNITFQVDMSAQKDAVIEAAVSGEFNGWSKSILTNDPSASFPTNLWYSGTFQCVTALVPTTAPADKKTSRFKYRLNGGWEEPKTRNPNGSNDRWFDISVKGDRVLPLVLYSDNSLCDVLPYDTEVTFQLILTNGTVATDGQVFDAATSTVHVNGESLLGTWESWSSLLPRLVRMGNTDIYTNTFLIPAGRPIQQKVKYSINGPDNEAPQFADHIQYIRSTNTTYVMEPVYFGTNYASIRVQQQWGNLAIGAPIAGNVPVTWIGCPCVTLQTRTSASSGAWVNLPATESASATNYPASAPERYFRLQKRQNP